jgi:hypothetical protein
LNALLDTYLRADHGSHSLLEVIGRAVMMSDLLPKMLDALCVLPTVPSSRKDCQDTLEVNYDFYLLLVMPHVECIVVIWYDREG